MRNGFTLIELLIVIAIVAILAGAMMPMINFSRAEARDARARADLDAIKTASIMYHFDVGIGAWPAPGSSGNGLVNDTGVSSSEWDGPYLDEWRSDPWPTAGPTDQPYVIYDHSVDTEKRYIKSIGPDHADNGDSGGDDIRLLISGNTAK